MEEQYFLVNINEEIIKKLALELMQKTDMCRCEKCYLDVCAMALNNVRGQYTTNEKGRMITNAMKTTVENKTEFIVAVSTAIELVKNKPMH